MDSARFKAPLSFALRNWLSLVAIALLALVVWELAGIRRELVQAKWTIQKNTSMLDYRMKEIDEAVSAIRINTDGVLKVQIQRY